MTSPIDKDKADDLMRLLTERLVQVDPGQVDRSLQRCKSLFDLCDQITREQKALSLVDANLKSLFPTRIKSLGHGISTTFFYSLSHDVVSSLRRWNNEYKTIGNYYTWNLVDAVNAMPKNVAAAATALANAQRLSLSVLNLLADVHKFLPAHIKVVYAGIGHYNQYLKDRFIKQADNKKDDLQQIVMMVDPHKVKAEYVKVKLIDSNPVLTDVLLEYIGALPVYRERQVKEGRKRKILRELSSYAVTEAADRLMLLSDPTYLGYLQTPKTFFERLGGALESFVAFHKSLAPYQEKLLDNPDLQVQASQAVALVQEFLEKDQEAVFRDIRKIKEADFDAIIQKEDEVLPDNRREKDHFKLREQLLLHVYNTLQDLSHLPVGEEKENAARDAVLKAVDVKVKIEEVLTSYTVRRLRKDKKTDNEFYVGRQGQIGMFYFAREPTPSAKLDDVIGTSFDSAKRHLQEVIETGNFPHVMRLSAPGGKVRSNILLIGPYGCGKTELARAVCSDERVIGATVSVASTLTAYMHESVNNVKRVYDAAKKLHLDARELKPVVLVLDEFDGWFKSSDYGHSSVDMEQIQNILLEVLDGMQDYNGVITMAMTNKPMEIPPGIIRRFRYVDIVGQLNDAEREKMLRMYLERSLPLHEEVPNHYSAWAAQLVDAPGDVIRKVVDEVHFAVVPDYIRANPKAVSRIERMLQKREMKKGATDQHDVEYLKKQLAAYRVITPDDVATTIEKLLQQPNIRMQIDEAKKCYSAASELLEQLSHGRGARFGFTPKDKLWQREWR